MNHPVWKCMACGELFKTKLLDHLCEAMRQPLSKIEMDPEVVCEHFGHDFEEKSATATNICNRYDAHTDEETGCWVEGSTYREYIVIKICKVCGKETKENLFRLE